MNQLYTPEMGYSAEEIQTRADLVARIGHIKGAVVKDDTLNIIQGVCCITIQRVMDSQFPTRPPGYDFACYIADSDVPTLEEFATSIDQFRFDDPSVDVALKCVWSMLELGCTYQVAADYVNTFLGKSGDDALELWEAEFCKIMV